MVTVSVKQRLSLSPRIPEPFCLFVSWLLQVTLGHMAMLPVCVLLAFTRMTTESTQIGFHTQSPDLSSQSSSQKHCAAYLFDNLSQARVLWEEEMFIKKLPSPDYLQASLWGTSLINDWCVRHQPIAGGACPLRGQGILGCVRKQAHEKQARSHTPL